MKDIEKRHEILKNLYANRKNNDFLPAPDFFPFQVDADDILYYIRQLKDLNLVDALIADYISGPSRLIECKINTKGIDFIENDSSFSNKEKSMPQQNITISGSSNFSIGNNNQITITNSVQDLLRVIESSTAPVEQQIEAKKLLHEFLKHPLLCSLLGGALPLISGLSV